MADHIKELADSFQDSLKEGGLVRHVIRKEVDLSPDDILLLQTELEKRGLTVSVLGEVVYIWRD